MAQERAQRRLAAILAADVVGYGRLMEQDEAGTFDRLRALRTELFEPEIQKHNGRIFKLIGDGLLAEFGSVVDAVECTVVLQCGMAERNAGLAAGQRIDVRMGLNLGDVIVEGEDRHGDGVNIAARLQQLAEPGGIAISRNVYNQVKNKVGFRFEALGEHQVKNIAERVTVYRVLVDGAAARPRVLLWAANLLRQRRAAIGISILLLVGIAALAWYPKPNESPPTGKPAIAVLPLEDIGGDEATGRLADGLTEDIITDLARFPDLDVIARNSTAVYKGKPVDVRQVGKDLKVGYVLEGSLQRQADQIRITAQLIDSSTGANLWSERWERPAVDMFAVQTEVAERVAGTLGSVNGVQSINAAEIRKIKGRPPTNLTAYEFYLLAVEAKGAFTKEAIFAGFDYATKAIALDPNFARAYAVRARLGYNRIHYGVDYDTAMRAMEADAKRAVDLDPNDPEAQAAMAWYLNNAGRLAESETEILAALQANPANVNVLIMAAATLAWSGKPEKAAELADKVLRIDPRASSGNLNTIKDAYFFSRRFDDLIAVVSRLPENARSRGSRLFLTFSYAFLAKHDELERARTQLLTEYPSMSAELLLNTGWFFARPQEKNLFLDGFRAASVPLCASDGDLATITKPTRLPECVKP
jgi:TolB-like protein/class 3 adenylate cyclase